MKGTLSLPLGLDVALDRLEVGAATGAGVVGGGPEVDAPEFAADLGEVALAQEPGGDKFERVDQPGDG